MRHVIKVFTLLLVLLWGSAASAKWVEIESENFIFRGDVSVKDGEYLIRELEGYRANILGMYGLVGKPEVVKVPVYSVKNSKMLKAVYGTDNVGGVYTTDFRGPIFLLSSQRGFGNGKEARYIAFHEYSHHLIAAYTATKYPLWYNEGFANFLATYQHRDATFTIGAPKQVYGPVLQQKKWLPMEAIIGSVKRYPFSFSDNSVRAGNTASFFYAQSWLAVHNIQSDPDLSKKFLVYLKRLNEGEDSVTAFEESMGMTLEQFEKRLRAYVKRNRFSAIKFNATAQPQDFDIEIREISKAEGLRHLADASLAFSANDRGFERTIAAYDKAEKALGLTPAILVGRADMASANEDYEAVEELIAQALALEPGNLEARRVGGSALIRAYESSERGADALTAGRVHLKAVLEQVPNDPSANYFYALSYRQDRNPPADAVSAARSALRYYRDGNFIDSNMNLAQVLFNGGDYAGAKRVAGPASVWGSNLSIRNAAASLLRYIEKREP